VKIAAVRWDQAVDHGDIGIKTDQAPRQVRADKSKSTGDEDALPGKMRRHISFGFLCHLAPVVENYI
jgi:hypothetical protein